MGAKLIPTLCHGCSYGGYNCGLLAHVRNGTFAKVEGNPHHPLNEGKLCAKGQSAVQWVYNGHRLKYPMARVGKKGSNKFERITWDDALDTIAGRLMAVKERFGPEYIMLGKGQSSSWGGLHQLLWIRFMHALGSPFFSNWSPSVCYGPQLMYHRMIIGGPSYARPDYANADLILEWFTGGGTGGAARRGVETLDTNLRSVPATIIDRVKKGAKLFVINPQLIPLAANGRASKWIPVRPGTDAALALAMINVILEDRLYDRAFVSRWCEGFDALKKHMKKYSPEWAEKITDIPADEIRALASEYATTRRACIRISEAPQKQDLQSLAMAIPILMAITGHLDRPGGNVWFYPAGHLGFDVFSNRVSENVKKKLPGGNKFYIRSRNIPGADFVSVIQALIDGKPYRPKAMLLFGSNPLSTARNPLLVAEALQKLEFSVVVDVVPTPTSRYADMILPAATRYECGAIPGLWNNHVAMSQNVIDPLWESQDELQITLDLACRLGMNKDFWNGDRDAMVRDFLRPAGIRFDLLKQNALKGIFLPRTEWMDKRERFEKIFEKLPNGRIQLYNSVLEMKSFEALPEYKGEHEDPINAPALHKEYPLLFTDEHSAYLNHHSWMREIPWLRDIQRHPHVRINPVTARKYVISDGDWVEIVSRHGTMKAVAFLFPGIRPDMIMGQHGWGQGCDPLGLAELSVLEGGVNPNSLYDWERRDPITGSINKNTLVRIKKE